MNADSGETATVSPSVLRLSLRLALPLSLAAVLLVGLGCTRPINRTAERRIRERLPLLLGPAESWHVRVTNPWERTISGRLRRVTIDGTGVALRDMIRCDQVHIDISDLDIDTRRQEVRSVGATTFAVVVSDRALSAYLSSAPREPNDPIRIKAVRAADRRITIDGTRWLVKRAWPFRLAVVPRLASPTRLEFDPREITAARVRVPLPAKMLGWFARRLDSGFDFSALPFPVSITEFRSERGQVRISGSADVHRLLQEETRKAIEH